jgi:hypothetical protein
MSEKHKPGNQRKIRRRHTPCAVVLGKQRHTECAYHNLIGLPYLDAPEKGLIRYFFLIVHSGYLRPAHALLRMWPFDYDLLSWKDICENLLAKG